VFELFKINVFELFKINVFEDSMASESSAYLAKKHVVRLIFNRHQHYQNPIEKLKTFQRRDTHVQEDTEQYRHRYIPQHRC